MAAIVKPTASAAQIASQSITSNTTTAGGGFAISAATTEVIIAMTIGARTDGTYVNTLQGSIDGTTFVTLKSGSNITAAGTTFLSWNSAVDGTLPPIIRAAIVSTSVTTGVTATLSTIYVNKQ